MILSALEWLELQSKRKLINIRIDDINSAKDKELGQNKTVIIEVGEQNLPNYIDPNTGLPYDPFRENEERGRKLTRLRKLRAVLP